MRGYIQDQASNAALKAFSIRIPTRYRRKDIQFKEMKAVHQAI